MLKIELF